MNREGLNVFYWLPRLLAVVLAVFLGIFALDVFLMQGTFLQKAGGFFMHLVPTFIILFATVVAWRYERIGGLLFLALGFGFTVFFQTFESQVSFLIISLPVFVIGFLFLYRSTEKR